MTDAPIEEPEFRLDRNDVASLTWAKLSRHIESKIARLRVRNDNNLSPDDTAMVRGEIKGLKNLLALAQPDPAVVAVDAEQDE